MTEYKGLFIMEHNITTTEDEILFEYWKYIMDNYIEQGLAAEQEYRNYKSIINFGVI